MRGAVALHVQQAERRRRLVDVSAASRGRTPRAPARLTPSRACATKLRNGTGGGKLVAAALQDAPATSRKQHLQRGVVADQVVEQHAAAASARRCRIVGANARAAAAPAAGPAGSAADRSAAAAAAPTSPAGVERQLLPPAAAPGATPPAPARGSPPTAPPCAGCRAGRSPPAAPARTRPAARGCRTPSSDRQQVRVALAVASR